MIDIIIVFAPAILFIFLLTKGKVNIGETLSYIPLDLSKDASIKAFFVHLKKFKRIDILVNNAGINIIEPIDAVKPAHWDKVLKVNLTGSMLLTSKISALMKWEWSSVSRP